MLNSRELYQLTQIQKAKLKNKMKPGLRQEFFVKCKSQKPIILKLSNVYKVFVRGFRKSHIASNNINLSIHEGERIAFVGNNGAGKSTLLDMIANLTSPTSGKIYYNYKYKTSPIEKIGIQFQKKPSFPTGLSVKDIITFMIEIYKLKISKEELEKLYNVFQLKSLLNHTAKSLSGGQQQRLNIMLALIHKPKILLLDELNTGLDIKSQKMIVDFLKEEINKNNMTLMISSHFIEEIETLCNRIILINKGSIMVDAPIDQIKKKFKSVKNFLELYLD